ncbi:hypothetical protein ACIRP2_01505 [Streptomyces sp. NPDC101194]|uniref:hypothetical protein n=1 Tax=Streptomyces sp. NPDC101194 TaxID=3366127 RepID=UPI00380FCE63
MRILPAVVVGASVLTLATVTSSAQAQDTTVTFTVQGSNLVLSAPAGAALSNTTFGGTASGQLGTVTVNDERGVVPAPWTATVTSTAFTTGAGGANQTIPNSDVEYWSGPSTSTNGSGTFTPGQATAAAAVTVSSAQTAFAHTGGGGANNASWNPTVIVNVPSTVAAGEYTGTITHSVA